MLICLYFSVEEVALIRMDWKNLSWNIVLAYLVEKGITSLEMNKAGEKVKLSLNTAQHSACSRRDNGSSYYTAATTEDVIK